MASTPPVSDWTSDYDIFDSGYINDPVPVWDELRDTCPIAHTDRWGGSWLPTKYDDVQAMSKMVPELSSTRPLVTDLAMDVDGDGGSSEAPVINAPPISADPPLATWTRRLILPTFAPRAVERYRPYTEQLCHELVDSFIENGSADAATDYAQQIPPRVIAHLLGVDPGMADDFTDWVRGVLELGLSDPVIRAESREKIFGFLTSEVEDRMANPRDDFLSNLLAQEHEGDSISPNIVVGMANLLLVAGIDTTWSSIGSALWHLGTFESDRRWLAGDDELFPSAIEELLRAYSPVTMARVATEEVDIGDVTICPGDKVLMNFPGANMDPKVFENPHEVQLDRQRNRHVAFGAGIHRCAGSNLARMEMDIALRVWMERIPEFVVSSPDEVTWAGGQVRGPRYLPVTF